MNNKKWECEIIAPPELHKPIQELFDAISWKLKHAESSSAQIATEINVGDTIYRQAAIDAICKACSLSGDYQKCDGYPEESTWCEELVALRALPSAQPEPCEDTVSRQRLLSDLKELVAAWKKYPVMAEQIKGVEAAIGYVGAIPPAQPQRKTGKWINHRKDYGHNIADCDQCGNAIQWFDGDEIPRYCCMCGADMRGESNDSD